MEPGAGIRPVLVSGSAREAEQFRSLFDGKAGEIAQFYKLANLGLLDGECRQCIVQKQQLVWSCLRNQVLAIKVNTSQVWTTSFLPTFTSCVLDQYPPHRLGGRAEKMAS